MVEKDRSMHPSSGWMPCWNTKNILYFDLQTWDRNCVDMKELQT
jgi:hypothetical protein